MGSRKKSFQSPRHDFVLAVTMRKKKYSYVLPTEEKLILHEVVATNNLSRLMEMNLLRMKIDASDEEWGNRTALHVAAEKGASLLQSGGIMGT